MWGELWTDDNDGEIVVLTHKVLITSLFRSKRSFGKKKSWQHNNQHKTLTHSKIMSKAVFHTYLNWFNQKGQIS